MVTAEMVDGVLRTFRLTRAQYKVDTGMKPWYVSQPPQPQGALGPGLPGRDQPEDNRHGRDHRHVREAILGGLRGRSVYDSCGTRSSVPATRGPFRRVEQAGTRCWTRSLTRSAEATGRAVGLGDASFAPSGREADRSCQGEREAVCPGTVRMPSVRRPSSAPASRAAAVSHLRRQAGAERRVRGSSGEGEGEE
jgi:hypothetical protein